jgi:DNA recombination protein RmuC
MVTTLLVAALLVAGAFLAGIAVGRRSVPAVGALLDVNRAVLEQERARGTAELDGKKGLIDQQLAAMTSELRRVGTLVHDLETDRRQSFGVLATELRRQHEGLRALNDTTQRLRESLSSTKVRGQWGERMAEDVLRLAGFLEGVNYRKQATLPGAAGRPDFTFLLPNDLVLHMDGKFPLDNFVRYLEAASDHERTQHRDQFLRDVRARVNELVGRGYLDAADATVDCLLLFIPNEQVYAFVHENDPALLDHALTHKIVLCSPLTLYAVLAVVRQSVDNFRLERTSGEILRLLSAFSKQWEKYAAALDTVHRRFDAVARDYETLMSTRHRALQRPLDQIELLRRAELTLVGDDDPEAAGAPPVALSGGG